MKFECIDLDNNNYPSLLKEIQNPPSCIYVRGELSNGLPSVAIVGTRKATTEGKRLAENIAYEIASCGVSIASGLAMGIDTAAHRGALRANGTTVAVLGNGIDSVYPVQNEKLAEDIIKNGGAVISEYGPGEPSFKGRFLERNRIISGISLGTVVIEAPLRSGALNTAKFAGEQGRHVFAIPGPVTSSHYEGSHRLIRDGVTLVTSAAEILEDIGIKSNKSAMRKSRELSADEYNVVSVLENAGKPLNVDTIIELTTLEPHMVSQVITTLAIEDIVKESDLGYEISNS